MKTMILLMALSLTTFSAQLKIADSSKVGFSIQKHKIGAPVDGRFDDFSGTVTIADGMMSAVNVTIQMKSINTENEKRDNHLRSPDFFDVTTKGNETMTFVSNDSVKVANKFKLKGTLTLKGVTKDVVLDVAKTGDKKFSATTTINKSEFNVKWNRELEKSDWKKFKGLIAKTVLGEDVDIKLMVHLQ